MTKREVTISIHVTTTASDEDLKQIRELIVGPSWRNGLRVRSKLTATGIAPNPMSLMGGDAVEEIVGKIDGIDIAVTAAQEG